MTRRDLNEADRILWDFIFGHLMHLSLIYIYHNNQNMITIVAVRPNDIIGWQYLFSGQIEPLVFFFLAKYDIL
jgi:hypothetical protein